ncbi:hypothetical protein NY607_06940 [Lysinibacillus sp. A4]|uniref:hypothetical protein n=1 Tax=unclassified Lysinibacillus TaxID=2636778 RepID=UPI001EDC4A64|nr:MULTISPECIES: hypothetical protein [unclassified Lysinibacillus]MCS5500859.1 hypothetical protein [Lysinibacillus sp. A4]UKJ44274.1 hypothetical protein L6W14_16105 [Lysinibacillus sp. ACHW1.5]
MPWKSRPAILNNIPGNIDNILAIDENGIPSLKDLLQPKNDLLQWFTITGVVFTREGFKTFIDDITKLKNKYWNNGCFNKKKVVFHSRDIRKKTGAFNPKLINYEHFLEDLKVLISDSDYSIYSSSIDKFSHVRSYINPYPVYDLCLEFLLERYCYELNSGNKNGIIVVESRGEKENKLLLDTALKLITYGNRYHDSSFFSNIKGIYFNPKRTKDKKLSYPQLELADLVSFPIHSYVKNDYKSDEFSAIESKLYNYPNYQGYGMKLFPNK